MSNLTQLANGAQRKAETAERTAGRHQERVDVWEDHVRNRRPGSSERRRAERRLRRSRELRDRAQRRAARQRAREAAYRARAAAEPPAPPRPRRGRWQPNTPWGKAFAASLLGLGLATGIAIGGAGGFNPLGNDSQVVIEVDAPAPAVPPAPVGPPAPAPAPVPAAAVTPDAAAAAVADEADRVSDQVTAEATESATEPTADEPIRSTDTPATPSQPIQPAQPAAQPDPEPAAPAVDQDLQNQRDDCHMYLDDYPLLIEIDSSLRSMCDTDPATARSIIGPLLQELMGD